MSAVKDPARERALLDLESNPLIARAIELEPAIGRILNEAKEQQNEPGYHRIRTYIALRNDASHYVGWDARKRELGTMEHYDAIVNTIRDLLPADDVDLYPEGKDV